MMKNFRPCRVYDAFLIIIIFYLCLNEVAGIFSYIFQKKCSDFNSFLDKVFISLTLLRYLKYAAQFNSSKNKFHSGKIADRPNTYRPYCRNIVVIILQINITHYNQWLGPFYLKQNYPPTLNCIPI